MRRALVLLLLTSSLAAAGCFGNTAEDAPVNSTAAQNANVTIGERPEPTFTDVQAGTAAAPDSAATLDTMPQIKVGEWWRIKMQSPLDGREAEYTRVMAYQDGDTYVFGMPHEGWYKEAVVYHVPFFGDVNLDLSGHAHDIPFVPLKFPLNDEQTWTTKFEGGPDLTATVVTNQAAKTAEVTFTNPSGGVAVSLVYDAKIHEIVHFEHSTIIYDVVEHGYDWEGWVTVPRAEDLVFFHGRLAQGAAITPTGIAPNPNPFEQVEIAGGFNRMSFILLIGDIGLVSGSTNQPVAPGVYGIKATDPEGNVFELPPQPMTGGLKVEFFESTAPDGIWNLEYVATGPGVAFIEGIAYHQYDIKVPTGEKRSDHSHPVIR